MRVVALSKKTCCHCNWNLCHDNDFFDLWLRISYILLNCCISLELCTKRPSKMKKISEGLGITNFCRLSRTASIFLHSTCDVLIDLIFCLCNLLNGRESLNSSNHQFNPLNGLRESQSKKKKCHLPGYKLVIIWTIWTSKNISRKKRLLYNPPYNGSCYQSNCPVLLIPASKHSHHVLTRPHLLHQIL